MVAINSASVNRFRRRTDVAKDGFDGDITIEDNARPLFAQAVLKGDVIDIWSNDAPAPKTPPAPKAPAANDDIKTHDALLSGNAGFVTSPLAFVDGLLAEGEINQQSRIIAQKLESVGWNPYQKGENNVVLIGTVNPCGGGSVRCRRAARVRRPPASRRDVRGEASCHRCGRP